MTSAFERQHAARGAGVRLGFLFVPINLVSYVGMPAEKSNSVAGLVNFMRNIGSSIGTSMVTTLIARRAQIHQVYLAAHVTAGRPALRGQLSGLAARLVASGMNAARAAARPTRSSYRAVIGQATTLAYIDTFWFWLWERQSCLCSPSH